MTDADGDNDTAAINLGTGVFQIEDDGPNAVEIATADTLVLDESAGGYRRGRRQRSGRPGDGDGELRRQLRGGETSAPTVLAATAIRWL